jgi:uncharacterized membrane protein
LFAKAIIYRFFSVIATFLISFAVTGSMQLSLGISALDFVGKTLLYFVFDISWNKFIRRV